MKISMLMTCLVAAFCVAGCRYGKVNEGLSGEENAVDIASGSDISGSDIDGSDAMSGDAAAVTEGKFEDLYTRCDDVSFSPVYFGLDSTVIAQDELGKVEAVASHLKAQADRVVVVEGHCDERGSNEYNMSLGENRAIIIRNYLEQTGVDGSRIQTRSYGEEKPAVLGHNEAAWAKNRRGEFVIFKK